MRSLLELCELALKKKKRLQARRREQHFNLQHHSRLSCTRLAPVVVVPNGRRRPGTIY